MLLASIMHEDSCGMRLPAGDLVRLRGELEALAIYMGHSLEMQRGSYDR